MLSFVRDEKENSRAAPQSWPPFLEGLNQIARFVAFVAKHPLASWPPEGREKLAAELAPINAALRL
jgi:hypothetical protein